jgi:predicted phosphodiesterase
MYEKKGIWLEGWPPTCQVEIPGLGDVFFRHATPRNDTEIFTRLTPGDRLLPIFEGLGVAVVVCGHSHIQFDRMVGPTRIVNAGSVGMPFGEPGGSTPMFSSGTLASRPKTTIKHAS